MFEVSKHVQDFENADKNNQMVLEDTFVKYCDDNFDYYVITYFNNDRTVKDYELIIDTVESWLNLPYEFQDVEVVYDKTFTTKKEAFYHMYKFHYEHLVIVKGGE